MPDPTIMPLGKAISPAFNDVRPKKRASRSLVIPSSGWADTPAAGILKSTLTLGLVGRDGGRPLASRFDLTPAPEAATVAGQLWITSTSFTATRHDRSRSLGPGARVVPGASRGNASAFLMPDQEPIPAVLELATGLPELATALSEFATGCRS